jgi:serine/threonine protein kinase
VTGSYRFIREIGSGAFGRVDEVEAADGRRLARKTFALNDSMQVLLRQGQVNEAQLTARFRREVKYQSLIHHENVIAILDSDLQADAPWCVMELASGTLESEIKHDRTLGGDPRAVLFDVLAGLEAIHALGLVHRDLKPANVLKLTGDGRPRYAISDFGLVNVLSTESTRLTQEGQAAGTPVYAAPEQMTHFKHVTHAADIYSFGAIMHDIFDGGPRAPFLEMTVPGPCKEIVERCTKRNPLRRYASVAELREALYGVLHTQPVHSRSAVTDMLQLLQDNTTLSDEQWDQLFDVLTHARDEPDVQSLFYRYVRAGHLRALAASSPVLLSALSTQMSDYARSTAHDFDYCDVLADKLTVAFELGNAALRAHCLITLLAMGVSHNRWFVERRFIELAAPSLSDAVAQRVAMDVAADGLPWSGWLAALKLSLRLEQLPLHPMLASIRQ